MKGHKIQTIEGPIYLGEYFSQRHDKHIYLFGDIHIRRKRCPIPNTQTIHIVNFIKQTVRDNPEKVVDVFIEVDFASSDSADIIERNMAQFMRLGHEFLPSNSYLMDLRQEFYDCLQIDKSRCPDQQTRYHWSDARNKGIIGEWLQLFHEITSAERLQPLVKTLLILQGNELLDRTPTDIVELYRQTKVWKQIQNIPFDDVVQAFRKHYDREIITGFQSFRVLWRQLNQDSHEDEFHEVSIFLLTIISQLMDAYTMARVFRTFTQKPGQFSGPPQYIIVYAGIAHIEGMKTFLGTLNGMELIAESKSEIIDKDHQCLLSQSQLPFFQRARPVPQIPRENPIFAAMRVNGASIFIEAIRGTRFEAIISRGGSTLFIPADLQTMPWLLQALGVTAMELFAIPEFEPILRSNIVDRSLTIDDMRNQPQVRTLSRTIFTFTDTNLPAIDGVSIIDSFEVVAGRNRTVIHIIDGLLATDLLMNNLRATIAEMKR